MSKNTFVLLVTLALFPATLQAQRTDEVVYKLNLWADIPLTIGGLYGSTVGLNRQDDVPRFTLQELNALDPDRIPWFDRSYRTVDPTREREFLDLSDAVLNVAALAPLSLLIDRRVRRQWFPVILMYFEAAGLTGALQTNSSVWFDRTRPIAYLTNATFAQRSDNRNHFSFFSGHASNAAVGLFFMAKVLDDLHPELGKKRWWLYGAAFAPSAVVGWTRMRGGKHFLSDVVAGVAGGAAVGYFVPHFHHTQAESAFSFIPTVGKNHLGAVLRYRL